MTKDKFIAHVWFQLCSGNKVIQDHVCEKLLVFDNEQKYHEHMSAVTFKLTKLGLAYNVKNVKRYYNIVSHILTKDEKAFVFQN